MPIYCMLGGGSTQETNKKSNVDYSYTIIASTFFNNIILAGLVNQVYN